MLFSSNLFLFLFLPCVILGYYLLGKRFRNLFLLMASLVFYAWGTGKFVLVMIGSILFNYLMALIIDALDKPKPRRLCLILAVAGNLSVLFVYKYLDFFIANLNLLGFQLPLPSITLPLGISFFTFQAMSYTIDVYRGTAKVQKKPQNIGLYVSFFPQLVAGPIVRYQTIADQIDSRQETFDDFADGVKRFIAGFAKKSFFPTIWRWWQTPYLPCPIPSEASSMPGWALLPTRFRSFLISPATRIWPSAWASCSVSTSWKTLTILTSPPLSPNFGADGICLWDSGSGIMCTFPSAVPG